MQQDYHDSVGLVAVENPYWEQVQDIHTTWDGWKHRSELVKKYAWAIPDPGTLSFIAQCAGSSGLVEIGAGTGYWAWQLSQFGVDVLAFDQKPPQLCIDNPWHNDYTDDEEKQERMPKGETREVFSQVYEGRPETSALYPDRTLFLCWPPYDDDMAYRCLKEYKGDCFIFIGESEGGCTGNDDFFAELEAEWEEVACHALAQWYGLHDYVYVYKRKVVIA